MLNITRPINNKIVFLALLLSFSLGCAHILPPTEPTPPSVVAGPPDVFTDYIADCGDLSVTDQSAKATSVVQGCLDFDAGFDDCLVKGTDNFSKDTIDCVTIDLNAKWQRLVANDTATDMQKANTAHANTWIRNHRVGARR